MQFCVSATAFFQAEHDFISHAFSQRLLPEILFLYFYLRKDALEFECLTLKLNYFSITITYFEIRPKKKLTLLLFMWLKKIW